MRQYAGSISTPITPKRAQNSTLVHRQERSRPLAQDLETWLREERASLSSKSPVAKAIHYSLKRWAAMTRFLDDGRVCLSNNAAERACAASPSAGTIGPLPAPTEAASVPPPSIR